jgi:TolB-like protein/Flp pilus assembly protein TadD
MAAGPRPESAISLAQEPLRSETPREARAGFRLSGSRVIAPAIILGLVSIALALALHHFRTSGKAEQIELPRTIAVLPFKPLAPNNRDEAFELGMADALITKLSGLGRLVVRPTGAIRKYSSIDQDPIAAGREQRVEAVLEGSLHRAGERVRVTVRLLDTRDGLSLWSHQSDEYFTDIFTAQDAISEKIAKALALKLTGGEAKRLAKRYTENTEAYQAYVKGRYFMDKRTEEGFQKAIEYFQQAIGKDPRYALAYAGLADCHNLLGGYGLLPPKETYPRGKAAAMKALEFDEQLAEAHTALAVAKARYDWDWTGAQKDFKRAIELNPGYATARQWYAVFSLVIAERFDDAIAEAQQAQQIDPLSLATGVNAVIVNYFARRFDQAIEQSDKTLEMDQRFIQAYEFLGRAYEQKGMAEDAIAAFQKALELRSDYTHCLGPLGRAYAVFGRRDEARRVLDQLKGLSRRRYVMPYHIATIYTALGDNDQAFTWLQKAFDGRDDRLIFLKVDPSWDNLRSDHRFADLERRIGLSH